MPSFNIETLSLTTALVIAVIYQTRKLDEKDKVIAEALRILERSAEATEAVAAAMERLRGSLLGKRKSTEP